MKKPREFDNWVADGSEHPSLLLMRTLLRSLGLLLLITSARADLITFDDLNPARIPIPGDYAGLAWGPNWDSYGTALFQAEYGVSYDFPSFETGTLNDSGVQELIVSSPTPINFYGAYFSALNFNNTHSYFSSDLITLQGYRSGVLIGSVTMALPCDHFQRLEANFLGVDELHFVSDRSGSWWLMDNFDFADQRSGPRITTEPERLIGICFFAAPPVLDAARVKDAPGAPCRWTKRAHRHPGRTPWKIAIDSRREFLHFSVSVPSDSCWMAGGWERQAKTATSIKKLVKT